MAECGKPWDAPFDDGLCHYRISDDDAPVQRQCQGMALAPGFLCARHADAAIRLFARIGARQLEALANGGA